MGGRVNFASCVCISGPHVLDVRQSAATVSSYLSIMEVSCVFYRLAPYQRHKTGRLIKSPKFYFGDAGLACYLAGTENISDDPLKGAMVETYVAQNIVGILDATWPQANLFFWNIQGRHEVDFIIEAGNKCVAIEVKAAARWEKNDLAGLRTFIAATPHCVAAILAYNGPTAVNPGGKLWAIPLSLLLS